MKYGMCEKHKKVFLELGYIAWSAWADEQEKNRIKQRLCELCGYYFYPEEF